MRKVIKIIGISPGTRYMGYAIFHGSELKDWGVRNIAGRRSKRKLVKAITVVSDMIRQYEPDVLSIKALHPSRSSANLNRLVSETKESARRKGLKVYQYSIGELEAFFCPEDRISRRELAEIVTVAYPFLSYELDRQRAIRNPYYIRSFEAVALGSMCFQQLDGRR